MKLTHKLKTMNEQTYIFRRTALNSAFRKFMKAKKAFMKNEIEKKEFDFIKGELNALNKMYKTEEYIKYQDERRG